MDGVWGKVSAWAIFPDRTGAIQVNIVKAKATLKMPFLLSLEMNITIFPDKVETVINSSLNHKNKN